MAYEVHDPFDSGIKQAVVQETPYRARYSETGSREVPIGGLMKRSIDISICILLAPIFFPLFIGLLALIKWQDGGAVFYGHSRIGFKGRRFKCWKFRTMVENGDEVLEQHFKKYPEDKEIWLRERKLENDPRVTPLGAVLRKLSLDELPQIFNVICGEMSVVGPRPVVHDELDKYETSRQHYLRARPGVTGLWQVSGRSDTGYRERVCLDRYYVSNWRPLLDFWVVMRTVPAVVMARGAR